MTGYINVRILVAGTVSGKYVEQDDTDYFWYLVAHTVGAEKLY